MTVSFKHAFTSAKVDGTDSTLIQPSNWNAEHVLTLAAGKVLGRDASGSGAAQELAISVDATQQSMIPPSGNTASRPATAVAGMMRYNTTTAKFEGYNGAWGTLGGGALISDTAPSSPVAGDLWWKSSDGQMYIYYDDGTSTQWVIANYFTGLGTFLPLTGGTLSGNLVVDTSSTTATTITALNTNASTSAVADVYVSIGTTKATFRQFGASHPSAPNQAWLYTNDANSLVLGTNSTARVYIDGSGYVGVGAANTSVLDTVGANRPLVVTKSDTATTAGSSSAAIAIVNSDTTTSNLTQLNFAAITGSNTNAYSSGWIAVQHGARTNGQYPTGTMIFATSTTLNLAPSEKFRIDNNGNALVTGPGGLGYGTGSGGTVSQLTSKATTVTLNKANGQITMNGAALAANTVVSMQVNNTTVAATDTVILTMVSGTGTGGAYVFPVRIGAAAFVVDLKNISGGSLSEAIVFNFSVIKAVTA